LLAPQTGDVLCNDVLIISNGRLLDTMYATHTSAHLTAQQAKARQGKPFPGSDRLPDCAHSDIQLHGATVSG
jgi:hypothetical protein